MDKKILIVDDAAFMRMMLKDILSRHNFNVCEEAENGLVAVKKFKELNPDLTILDITMPEMNGIDALKQIKEHDSDAKIIICSALGQQDMVFEAIQNGAHDFIVKPFQEERVIQAVKKILS